MTEADNPDKKTHVSSHTSTAGQAGPMMARYGHTTQTNRADRRTQKKIRRDAIHEQTQIRADDAARKRRLKSLPDDVRDLLDKITKPDVVERTRDIELHKWSREDALNMFFTLAHVHAKMMEPLPLDENNKNTEGAAPETQNTGWDHVQLIQAGPSAGVFYPVTEDSQSHLLITVNDPRHYLNAAQRDLTNDEALDALSEVAEKMVVGLYSLAGSLIPGSDSQEITELMGILEEVEEKKASDAPLSNQDDVPDQE